MVVPDVQRRRQGRARPAGLRHRRARVDLDRQGAGLQKPLRACRHAGADGPGPREHRGVGLPVLHDDGLVLALGDHGQRRRDVTGRGLGRRPARHDGAAAADARVPQHAPERAGGHHRLGAHRPAPGQGVAVPVEGQQVRLSGLQRGDARRLVCRRRAGPRHRDRAFRGAGPLQVRVPAHGRAREAAGDHRLPQRQAVRLGQADRRHAAGARRRATVLCQRRARRRRAARLREAVPPGCLRLLLRGRGVLGPSRRPAIAAARRSARPLARLRHGRVGCPLPGLVRETDPRARRRRRAGQPVVPGRQAARARRARRPGGSGQGLRAGRGRGRRPEERTAAECEGGRGRGQV